MAWHVNCGPFFIVGIKPDTRPQSIVGRLGDTPLTREIKRCPHLIVMLGRCCHTSDGSREMARPLRFIIGALLSRYVKFSGTLSVHYS